jgi:CheY-like chemotaxis protein
VVEDDPDVARLIGDQLRAAGYSVRSVASGEAALAEIAQARPDLVTLDIRLPGMSGADLAERLAMNPETTDLPVLVISVEDRDPRLKQYGVRALPKPLDREQMLAGVADLLADSERRPVLVIDDEPDVRELLRANLSRAGLEVLLAENGREGIELAREHRPGLILLDLMLPGVDGFSVLQSLKQHADTATIPVVAMTAHDDIRLRAKARLLSLGAADLVAKPLDMKALIQEVQLLVQADE